MSNIVIDGERVKELYIKLSEIAEDYSSGELAMAYGYYVALMGKLSVQRDIPSSVVTEAHDS